MTVPTSKDTLDSLLFTAAPEGVTVPCTVSDDKLQKVVRCNGICCRDWEPCSPCFHPYTRTSSDGLCSSSEICPQSAVLRFVSQVWCSRTRRIKRQRYQILSLKSSTEYKLEQFAARFDDVPFLGSDVNEHIQCVIGMLNTFAAAGHHQYTKGARLYVQLMQHQCQSTQY